MFVTPAKRAAAATATNFPGRTSENQHFPSFPLLDASHNGACQHETLCDNFAKPMD